MLGRSWKLFLKLTSHCSLLEQENQRKVQITEGKQEICTQLKSKLFINYFEKFAKYLPFSCVYASFDEDGVVGIIRRERNSNALDNPPLESGATFDERHLTVFLSNRRKPAVYLNRNQSQK